MRILLTNDDGWYAPGLWALAEALAPVGEVVVVAPDREQSGVGTSVTLRAPVRASEVTAPVEGVRAFLVEGTPADSVILGLEHLVGPEVDLVFSGINQGANLGEDILISGTVGAALQGYCRGIPSVAISVAALKDVHYTAAARLAPLVAHHLGRGGLSRPLLLNVNVPNLPPDKIRSVELTRLGRRTYLDTVQQGEDSKRQWFWIRRTTPTKEVTPGTDVYAVRHKRISITPVHTDLTQDSQLPALAELCQGLHGALTGEG